MPIFYWKYGNLDARTGEKTLTLRLFEEKYDAHLLALAKQWHRKKSQYTPGNLLSYGAGQPRTHSGFSRSGCGNQHSLAVCAF
jgi:hypothetical protein